MVENKFGLDTVDQIISDAELESNGVYTAVGTYSHFEMVELVSALSDKVDISIDKLIYTYGVHFFDILVRSYPAFFENQSSSFEFLSVIDSYIHPEVLKLYPDAELPRFSPHMVSENEMHLEYFSSRKMADFAHGLIVGTINHFKENITLNMELISEDKSRVMFKMIKQ